MTKNQRELSSEVKRLDRAGDNKECSQEEEKPSRALCSNKDLTVRACAEVIQWDFSERAAARGLLLWTPQERRFSASGVYL